MKIDLSHSPVIVNTFLQAKYSLENVASYVVVLEEILQKRKGPFVAIYEMSAVGWLGSRD
ncbi:MAG TPA: hypothetical protein DCE41_25320 [Cytophagales bacterium]|nr:hypothetical protein [Cytophagales bacterium]